ncbi:cupredoxin domain-containing protein [Nitrosopumilus sp.]|uniref:cupredoxin domain-containing protein n=1 Tax=Nitrosopumilus sp. TaxID=2024843 RepID=UPI00292DB3F3|nr:plastocyanin/azurin family copper-binding protein [Nitrosopumilus sp.]
MLKKITLIGTIGIVILVAVAFSFSDDSVQKDETSELIVEGDVIMPTKVSRPGCEESDQCYIPSQIVIGKGKQVTWLNEDSAFHSVTSGFYDAPTYLFDSGYLDPYQSFSLTFDEVGIYYYYCTLHPWMKGQVIVE